MWHLLGPLIFSTTGVMGPIATTVYRRLASITMISELEVRKTIQGHY